MAEETNATPNPTPVVNTPFGTTEKRRPVYDGASDGGAHDTDLKPRAPFTLEELLLSYAPFPLPGFPLPYLKNDQVAMKIRTRTYRLDQVIIAMPNWDNANVEPTLEEHLAFTAKLTAIRNDPNIPFFSAAFDMDKAVTLARSIKPYRLYYQQQEIF